MPNVKHEKGGPGHLSQALPRRTISLGDFPIYNAVALKSTRLRCA